MKSYGVTIQMKATEQYFPVVLFIMLYKVVLTFESVDEILWCYHSNETSLTVLSHGLFKMSFYLLSLRMKSCGVTTQTKPFWQNI